MSKPTQKQTKETPVRRHFIKEWMDARGMKPPELIEKLDADRSTVYRWLEGQMPQPYWQGRIAALFGVAPEALLYHPDSDWFARKVRGRDRAEVERMKQMIDLALPDRTSTDG